MTERSELICSAETEDAKMWKSGVAGTEAYRRALIKAGHAKRPRVKPRDDA